MNVSVCIPTYNRNNLLFESFTQILNDDRVDDIVIVDDCSNPEILAEIQQKIKFLKKVTLYRQPVNVGVYENKAAAVSKAKNEYCIIFDSDNVLTTDYLDKIYSVEWKSKTILSPDFAKPVFDYRAFSGLTINKTNVAQYAYQKGFDCLANTHNFFVHRDSYLSVWQQRDRILGADSIYFLYLWLMAGNDFHVLKGLEYDHRVGDKTEQESNYVTYARESQPIADRILQQIASMR